MCYIGHYSDIHSISAGRRRSYSIIDDEGHYNYLDIDQMTSTSHEAGPPPGTQGYEGLDRSDVSTFRHPQRPHHYAGLPSSTDAAEHVEMTDVDYLDPAS